MSAKGSAAEDPSPPSRHRSGASRNVWVRGVGRVIAWAFAVAAAGVLSLLFLIGIAVAVAYPNVPEISGLTDYRPKLPMRIYAADGVLLGEFGEERRNFTPIAQMPKVLKDAVLAAEDARFYEHGGVDTCQVWHRTQKETHASHRSCHLASVLYPNVDSKTAIFTFVTLK